MNNKKNILIGSRKSNLAKEQTSLVLRKLKRLEVGNFLVKYILSRGDKINYASFKLEGGKGLFTKELDNLLINGKIDLAIHSAKDIPAEINKEITIAAFLEREDVRDVLVTNNFNIRSIFELDDNFKFGSSSPRRINYIKNINPTVKIKNLRGNVESRIKKITEGRLDGTLLALAGLKRLKLNYDNVNFIKVPRSIILPAPGQGAIAIMCRKNDRKIIKICKNIEDNNTRITVNAERAFIKEINGNCFTPLAAFARVHGKKLTIRGRLFSEDGRFFSEKKVVGDIKDSEKIGKLCAIKVLKNLNK
ncbi:MAG: hydroxymethylbilane synthase [Alphaproteobacteria bacterium TMED93]|nr:MAG: hydroxymethylbilane synthase [Alphaproteobacteria bacterium TMED93]